MNGNRLTPTKHPNEFAQELKKNHIYLPSPGPPLLAQPVLESLKQRLAQRRPSLPSHWSSSRLFKEFLHSLSVVDMNEAWAMGDILSIITGRNNHEFASGRNQRFSKLSSITNDITTPPQPDFYDGYQPDNLDDGLVSATLKDFIAPRNEGLLAPNFFLEVKGPQGNPWQALLQACHCAAIGTRGMLHLQSFRLPVQIYDGNVYTISCVFQAQPPLLQIYAAYPILGEDGATHYHMTGLGSWPFFDANNCLEAITAFRNAREYAKEQRDALMSAAIQRVIKPEPCYRSQSFNHDHPTNFL